MPENSGVLIERSRKVSMRISKREAEQEAIRIAEAFVLANIPEGSSWDWECGSAGPDVLSPAYGRRKPTVKWILGVRWIPKEGGVFDGGGMVRVDIETKEASWAQ
jgi:hypothetical protein